MADQPSRRRLDSDEPPGPPEPGDVLVGKYVVEKVVGSGGMGVVLSARHLALGQSVAIKVLLIEALDESRRAEASTRFLREGQAAARLTSDHVVRVYDVGTTEDGSPFMVMELLRGDDLSQVISREGPAPPDLAVHFVLQACDAVGEAHALGIVHRDLKPSNLFVSQRPDGRAHVRVLDFGISKALTREGEQLEGGLTATRTVVGSPYYMSPEQVRDAKRVDLRTDIWALGMILYELLVGEPAFNAETLPGICAAIAADAPPPIRGRRPDISVELEAVVLRCLEKDPAKRYQKVEDLVAALRPFGPASGVSPSVEYLSRRKSLDLSLAGASAKRHDPTLDVDSLPSGVESGSRALSSLLRLDDVVPVAKPARADVAPPLTPATPLARAEISASATLVSPSTSSSPGAAGSALAPGPALDASLTEPAPPPEPDAQPKARRVGVAIGVVGLVLVGALVVIRALQPEPASPATAPTPSAAAAALPGTFELTLESIPGGATVVDGDRVLGTTPLTVSLEKSALAVRPRGLTVRKEGYEPYTIEQGPSDAPVRLLAALVAASRVAAPAPPALPMEVPTKASAKPSPRALPARKPPPRPAALPSSPPPKPPPPDIRLER